MFWTFLSEKNQYIVEAGYFCEAQNVLAKINNQYQHSFVCTINCSDEPSESFNKQENTPTTIFFLDGSIKKC